MDFTGKWFIPPVPLIPPWCLSTLVCQVYDAVECLHAKWSIVYLSSHKTLLKREMEAIK